MHISHRIKRSPKGPTKGNDYFFFSVIVISPSYDIKIVTLYIVQFFIFTVVDEGYCIFQ
jgi:hypothetical protein